MIFALALGIFAISRRLWLSEILLFVLGIALIVFSATVSTLLQRLVPREARGRVMSVNTMAWQGLEYAGVLTIGSLATIWTATPVIIGAALAIALVLAGIMLRYREVAML